MLRSVRGRYRDGKVELTEKPANVDEDTEVIVTFLETGRVSLAARGIDERAAAELRSRLASFAEEWDTPEMDMYDNYEALKADG